MTRRRDVGSRTIVHRYLNLLATSYLVHRRPAFAASRGKRVIRTPKLYLVDAGLAAFLAGFRPGERAARDDRLAGALAETQVS